MPGTDWGPCRRQWTRIASRCPGCAAGWLAGHQRRRTRGESVATGSCSGRKIIAAWRGRDLAADLRTERGDAARATLERVPGTRYSVSGIDIVLCHITYNVFQPKIQKQQSSAAAQDCIAASRSEIG